MDLEKEHVQKWHPGSILLPWQQDRQKSKASIQESLSHAATDPIHRHPTTRFNPPCRERSPQKKGALILPIISLPPFFLFPNHEIAAKAPTQRLTTEPIQRTPLPLQRIHDVQARDGLALRVLGVRDGVADDGLEEGLEDAARFFVDH